MEHLVDAVPSPRGHARGQLRVLFVGDRAGAAWLRTFLAAHGHESMTAPDALSALQAISDLSADVVVIDVECPASGGAETARRIRMAFGDDVRLIGLLPRREPDEAIAACELFDAVFARPIQGIALVAELDAFRAAPIH